MLSGVFLFLDQFLKWQSWHGWGESKIILKYFGWQPFLNTGVAFGLPVPSWLTVIVTVPIILGAGVWVGYDIMVRKNVSGVMMGAVMLIFTGAFSNLADRMMYGVVVDYFKFFTGVVNLADGMIVCGAGVVILRLKIED